MLLAVMPLPRPDMMPPVTTTYCRSARPVKTGGEERAGEGEERAGEGEEGAQARAD